MNSLSVVIPSKTEANLRACVSAIRAAGETCRIIVVDDGLPDRSVVDAITIDGIKPFVFARACNLGIQAAGPDDVILLNDDALLRSERGFTLLQIAAEARPEIGLVSATTNVAGNPAQFRQHGNRGMGMRICPSPTPGNSFATVAYICVLIPRRTIDMVGVLDERFGGVTPEGKHVYGWEDTDFSRRCHLAGLKIGIHDSCFVDHNVLPSTFRSAPHDLQAGRDIYLKKWGSF